MTTLRCKPAILAAFASLSLGLAACSEAPAETDGAPATDTVDTTIASALSDVPNMATLSGMISTAELGSVFDGPGSYTLLAPNDAAFSALGQQSAVLTDAEQRPVLSGLLREHILPGQLTLENIAQAIKAKGGPVTVTTLGGSDVTFSDNGGTISVDNGQGATATLTGKAVVAQNGTIIALDKVLLPGES